MKKYLGDNKKKVAVFISGNGSNLLNIIKFSLTKKSPISVKLIISNNQSAKGLKYSKIYNIKKKIITFRHKSSIELLLTILSKNNISLILLAGFMKILPKEFIKNFKGKILNIHPSLLPKYKGLDTHARVIKNKEKYTGCTVHYVNFKLDSGKIIIQKRVKVSKRDDPKSLAKKVLKQEHKIYPKAILKLFN